MLLTNINNIEYASFPIPNQMQATSNGVEMEIQDCIISGSVIGENDSAPKQKWQNMI